MAGDPKVMSMERPDVKTLDAAGEFVTFEQADHVWVKLDRFGNGLSVVKVLVVFADHAGVETEWDAGVSTTLLQAAIDSLVGTVVWPTELLTTAQRAVVGVEFTES